MRGFCKILYDPAGKRFASFLFCFHSPDVSIRMSGYEGTVCIIYQWIFVRS